MQHNIDQEVYCIKTKWVTETIIEYDQPVTSFWERLAFLFGIGRIYVQMDVKTVNKGTTLILKNHIAFLRK